MKHFYPTYLYIKTHNKTGLKYFGKTTNNPFTYYGSGKHWLAHLKKYGYDITTEILGYYIDKDECQSAALEFSILNDIVNSKKWANIILENGLDGGNAGGKSTRDYKPLSEETKQKIRESVAGRTAWNKGLKGATPGNKSPRTAETKEKLRKANLGKKLSPESIEKRRISTVGKKRPATSIALTGRSVSDETRKKISNGNKGKTVSNETKEKIKKARESQVFSKETREKLSGKIVVVDKFGNISKITKDMFYSQNSGDENEFVFHNSKEGKRRKNIKSTK